MLKIISSIFGGGNKQAYLDEKARLRKHNCANNAEVSGSNIMSRGKVSPASSNKAPLWNRDRDKSAELMQELADRTGFSVPTAAKNSQR